jgi:hypothetical protein
MKNSSRQQAFLQNRYFEERSEFEHATAVDVAEGESHLMKHKL